jgi:SPP1 family predicted phage head-tail adaptor
MTFTPATHKLHAGQLDQRITLQQRAPGQDALGNASGAWVTVREDWARARPLRGREFFAAGQTQASAEVEFTIRWSDDVSAAWRVLWNGTPHDIVAPPMAIDGQRQWLQLMCATGVRDAT